MLPTHPNLKFLDLRQWYKSSVPEGVQFYQSGVRDSEKLFEASPPPSGTCSDTNLEVRTITIGADQSNCMKEC